MELNQIGYFQFDNLVQNRVPFLLVNLGAEVSSWYKSVWAMHIENNSLRCSSESVLAEVNKRHLPSYFAILVLDEQGLESPKVAAQLEEAGFSNVYYVRGGSKAMLEEKSQSQ